MTLDPSEQMRRSWEANADAWTAAVRTGAIRTRRLGTDEAIRSAVLHLAPRRVLDLGCGEGWLVRALDRAGAQAVGVDASEPLIERAQALGGGTFVVAAYEDLARGAPGLGTLGQGGFDAVVCNFSLLGEELHPLLLAVRGLLAPRGALLIQTVHPWEAGEPYEDGWRVETFDGLGGGGAEPMPWYFRRLESWVALLRESGYRLDDLREPRPPESARPLSLILVASVGAPSR